jgi:RimJ/RimL family protein N-acetyltransferase
MRLITKRLILRDWKASDINDLIEGLNNIEVSTWLAYAPHPYTREDAEKWIAFCKTLTKTKQRNAYEFAIELQSERKVIGGVTLDKINRVQGTAGGGIWLNAKYHGRGYGTEAFGERIRFAFETLKLRRLENGFFKGNPSSFRMQKKFGYKIEGTRRKAFKCMADGKIKDEYITGLLREEWKKR